MTELSIPSIEAVAQAAGVSIATVSRVVNNSKPVSAQTRQRVEAAIEQLGYRVNVFGRSLRRAESRLLMVLVPDLANPYFAEIIRGIESVARTRDYNLLLSHCADGLDGEQVSLDALRNRMADGVICLTHFTERSPVLDTARELPWVSCSEYPAHSGVPHVAIDHRQAAMDAVQYLLHRKHRRIAFLGAHPQHLWAQQRLDGYRAALDRAGIPVREDHIRLVEQIDYESGRLATAAFLSLEQLPTAICTASDTLAIGAIKALKRAGLSVPEDVAVMGFDDIPVAAVYEPALTTIAQPMFRLGETAATLLLARLGGTPITSTLLPHTLVVRDSA